MSNWFSRHTSIKRAPFATWKSAPLIVTLINSVDIEFFTTEDTEKKCNKAQCWLLVVPLCPLWLITAPKSFLKVLGESLNRGLNGPRRCVSERTKRLAFNVVAKIQKQLDVAFASATAIHTFEDLDQPVGAFATRRTPAARLVLVKFSQVLG